VIFELGLLLDQDRQINRLSAADAVLMAKDIAVSAEDGQQSRYSRAS
jgi:hypothetical protein